VSVDTPPRAPAPAPRPPSAARLVKWLPYPTSGSLIGKASIVFPGGWRVNAIPIFRRGDGSLSASGPDAPRVDASGTQLRDADGKRIYDKVITFETNAARTRWNDAVLGALRDARITQEQKQEDGDL
jgi:hypothetical protein